MFLQWVGYLISETKCSYVLVIVIDHYCWNVAFLGWKFRKQGCEGREAHIGQAYTCINLNLLLRYEIAEQSSCTFPK